MTEFLETGVLHGTLWVIFAPKESLREIAPQTETFPGRKIEVVTYRKTVSREEISQEFWGRNSTVDRKEKGRRHRRTTRRRGSQEVCLVVYYGYCLVESCLEN